jgi:hypothetical protein
VPAAQPALAVAEVSGLDLKTFVRALGEDAPAPGAGAAGAVALGMAAACAAKAFAISARHRCGDESLAQASENAREISLLALGGADWDAQDYPALLRGQDPAARQVLKQDGEAAMALAGALRGLLEEAGPAVIPMLKGDLDAASSLLQAFEAIARGNLQDLG